VTFYNFQFRQTYTQQQLFAALPIFSISYLFSQLLFALKKCEAKWKKVQERNTLRSNALSHLKELIPIL
jgi:hypothetical protein